MTLNPDLVRSRCGDIEDALERLRRFAAMPAEEFVGSPDLVDAACYRLLVAIEAALALCSWYTCMLASMPRACTASSARTSATSGTSRAPR